MRANHCIYICILTLLISCQSSGNKLFQSLDPAKSGIHFSNRIIENDTMNILAFEYVFNGGGVAIGDVNQDSLPDLFFTGNQVPNKLYINQGNQTFKDISEPAGISAPEKWCSGVSMVDLNADGKLDIYVSATVHQPGPNRANMLFLNQGNNAEGIPTFKEVAHNYGIADTGHTTHSAFFDYDLDGDLDLYVLTDELEEERTPNRYRNKKLDGANSNTDRLYRNNGDETFTNVSREAGILIEGYGLGVSIGDINLDGWPDIYVTNDYISNDLLYINQQDGTFKNQISNALKHQSHSAMGNDLADINNDGLPDILALDMQPEYNIRQKTLTPANNYMTYRNNERYGYEFQYVRNTLQIHQGISEEGLPIFSEVGQLAGIYQTDWSWSPLIQDIDQDGKKDVLITNGFPRDITDLDFGNYRTETARYQGMMEALDYIPRVKIANYAYKQIGELQFEEVTNEWGLLIPSFSNGAALGDLDKDGDLDYVVNNIDDSAFVYINQVSQVHPDQHYLKIAFKGQKPNVMGLGTKVIVHFEDGQKQYQEFYPYRGYISSLEPILHFGLGAVETISLIEILWPDGAYQSLEDIKVDQTLILDQQHATERKSLDYINTALNRNGNSVFLQQVNAQKKIQFVHKEEDKIDFNLQRTLPHKYTQMGPGLAVGDIDGNGFEDIVIGGAAGKKGAVYLQFADLGFQKDTTHMLAQAFEGEALGITLFDIEMDGDLDAYISFGSYEFKDGEPSLLDKIFLNEGNGEMVLLKNGLPNIATSTACVKASDFDRDGDLDLFIGGRVVPGEYPGIPQSYLLINSEGTFEIATDEVAQGLNSVGMVSDALWTDVDNDGWQELMVVGDWMPITLFQNQEGKLANVTTQAQLEDAKGWWKSIVGGDFDRDGDTDYIVGNLGINTRYKGTPEYPLYVFADDFDENGSMDAILACYAKDVNGEKKLFPMHTRDDLIRQMQKMRANFPKYREYGQATMEEVLSKEDRAQAQIYQANHMQSSYLMNKGDGTFGMSPLPIEVQAAPVYGMLATDVDFDGYLDVLLVGNDYGTEVFTGRYDALQGMVLKGDGKGAFQVYTGLESGFFVPGDAKALVSVFDQRHQLPLIAASQNKDSLLLFQSIQQAEDIQSLERIIFQPLDIYANIHYQDGRTQKVEAYYGSSYLSHTSRSFMLSGGDVREVIMVNSQGKQRKWNSDLALSHILREQ